MASPSARANPSSPAATQLNDPRELETFLDGVIGKKLQTQHIPGAAVSVVKDGQVLFTKGYGTADLQTKKPVDAQKTLFRIASISKPFVATAVLQLAEQGKLDLHADINTYLKTFHIPETYPEPITLTHLLTHTSGFEAVNSGQQLAPTPSDLKPLEQLLSEQIPARVRPPGTLTAYSNYGFTLAGYIVEQVSGMPFEQYAEQHIFQPLGMHSSTFRQPLPSHLSADLAQGYTYRDGKHHPGSFEAIAGYSAGAMSSTVTDMAKYMIAQLQNGRLGKEQILQDATARKMQTQQFTNDPHLAGLTYGFEESRLNGQRQLVHSGGLTNYYSLLALLPEQRVGVFVTYNSLSGGVGYPSLPILETFLDHYFPAARESQPAPSSDAAERVSQISGTYWATGRNYTTWEKLLDSFTWGMNVTDKGDGRLEISWVLGPLAAGAFGPPVTYVEGDPWVFHQVDGQETVVFRPDASGTTMLRGSFPVEAFDKVPWYATPPFLLILVIAWILIFLSGLVLWASGFIRRIIARTKGRTGVPPQPSENLETSFLAQKGMVSRLSIRLAGTLCAFNVLLIIGLLYFLLQQLTGSPPPYYFGVPPLLIMLFALALVSVILTVVVVTIAILAWWKRFWGVGRRIHYSLVALAAVTLVWQLIYWNLLRFPLS